MRSSCKSEEEAMLDGCFPNESEEDDTCLLINDEELGIFNQDTSGITAEQRKQKLTRLYQRTLLLTLASVIPTLKFVVASLILFGIIMNDTIGKELTHPDATHLIQRGEMDFVYMIVTIPLTAVSAWFGVTTFIGYPRVMKGTMVTYIVCRLVVVAVEMVVVFTFLSFASFTYTLFEHVAMQILMITEAESLLILAFCSRKQIRVHPINELSSQEMHLLNSNQGDQLC